MKNKYRIIELTYGDGDNTYVIQKRKTFLGIRFWVYKTCGIGEDCDWSIFLSNSWKYGSIDMAKIQIDRIIRDEKSSTITDTKVIEEISD